LGDGDGSEHTRVRARDGSDHVDRLRDLVHERPRGCAQPPPPI